MKCDRCKKEIKGGGLFMSSVFPSFFDDDDDIYACNLCVFDFLIVVGTENMKSRRNFINELFSE